MSNINFIQVSIEFCSGSYTSNEKALILYYLANNPCVKSLDQIAREIGLGVRGVRTATNSLVKKGKIRWEKEAGKMGKVTVATPVYNDRSCLQSSTAPTAPLLPHHGLAQQVEALQAQLEALQASYNLTSRQDLIDEIDQVNSMLCSKKHALKEGTVRLGP